MFGWRVTRYDPALRGDHGAYPETWTSVSDIGSTFAGEELLPSEYDRVESLYVQTALRFAEAFSIDELDVVDLQFTQIPVPSPTVNLPQAADIIRAALREQLWCRLVDEAQHFELHFGDDLYMYVITPEQRAGLIDWAADLDIFIEPDFLSPYLPERAD